MTDVFLEVLHDPIGRWFVYVGVIVALVVGVVVAVLLVRKRLGAIAEDLGVIRHEVKNDHTVNMRVEQDHRHEENASTMRAILTGMEALTSSVEALQRGQGELYALFKGNAADVARHSSSIAEIEHTLDRRPDIVLEAEIVDDENGSS